MDYGTNQSEGCITNRPLYYRKRVSFWSRTLSKNDQHRTTEVSLWDRVFLNSLTDGSCLLCEGQRRTLSLCFEALFLNRPAIQLDTLTLANLTDSCLELCSHHLVVVSRLRHTLLSQPVRNTPGILNVLRLERSSPQVCSACDIEEETASRFTTYIVQVARSRQTFRVSICQAHYRTLVETKKIIASSGIRGWNTKRWWHRWLDHNCTILVSPSAMTKSIKEE